MSPNRPVQAPPRPPKRKGKNGLVALAVVTVLLCIGLTAALAVPAAWVPPAATATVQATPAPPPPTPVLHLHHHHVRSWEDPNGNPG